MTSRQADAMGLPPLSLYVHFPWCVRKCPYCDFNSHALRGELPEAAYLQALLRDLALQAGGQRQRALQSIFLGGGTPSLFPPAALARLLEGVRTQLPLTADAEITLEANPGTIERGRFADYRAAGITRVSLGAQSFDDEQLRQLGRIHAAADTRRAVEELHAAGLTNFNIDLMYGLPRQSLAGALADVGAAIALQPAHISHYQLTLEPGTVFAARPPAALPDSDQSADMQRLCQQRLDVAGFARYEVSAYAREGARCRHNLNYWRFGDYLGIGAGAHGKGSRLEAGTLCVERTVRPREPRRYLASLGGAGGAGAAGGAGGAQPQSRAVPAADLPFEFMMNALRLGEGFDARDFEARTGLPFERLQPPIERASRRGLLEHCGDRWRASPRGFDFLNDLLSEFLPEAAGPAPLHPADFASQTGTWA